MTSFYFQGNIWKLPNFVHGRKKKNTKCSVFAKKTQSTANPSNIICAFISPVRDKKTFQLKTHNYNIRSGSGCWPLFPS